MTLRLYTPGTNYTKCIITVSSLYDVHCGRWKFAGTTYIERVPGEYAGRVMQPAVCYRIAPVNPQVPYILILMFATICLIEHTMYSTCQYTLQLSTHGYITCPIYVALIPARRDTPEYLFTFYRCEIFCTATMKCD